MLTVEVQTRTLGSVKAEGPERLTLDVLEERLTVGELIKRTVEEGVREKALRLAAQGQGANSLPDARVQVEKALRAFEAGTYLVIVDHKRVRALDEVILFAPTTDIQFLRLTPLVGG